VSPQNLHSERQWQAKFFRCGMRCVYCLKPLSLIAVASGVHVEIATKDHAIPTSRGGSDAIDNILPACFECNRRKGNMTEKEFRAAIHTAFENATQGDAIDDQEILSTGDGEVVDATLLSRFATAQSHEATRVSHGGDTRVVAYKDEQDSFNNTREQEVRKQTSPFNPQTSVLCRWALEHGAQ
jgi:hypothetical protein